MSVTTQVGVQRKVSTPEVSKGGSSIDNEDPPGFRVPVAIANHTVVQRGEQSTVVTGREVGFLK